AEKLTHLWIAERSQHLIHDGGRQPDLKARLAQKPLDEPAWCTGGLDDRADVDVRVEDRARQSLPGPAPRPPRPLAGRALRFHSDLESFLLTHRALLLLLEALKGMSPREPPH